MLKPYKSLFSEVVESTQNYIQNSGVPLEVDSSNQSKLSDGSGPFKGEIVIHEIAENGPHSMEFEHEAEVHVQSFDLNEDHVDILINKGSAGWDSYTADISVLSQLKPEMTTEELEQLGFEYYHADL